MHTHTCILVSTFYCYHHHRTHCHAHRADNHTGHLAGSKGNFDFFEANLAAGCQTGPPTGPHSATIAELAGLLRAQFDRSGSA